MDSSQIMSVVVVLVFILIIYRVFRTIVRTIMFVTSVVSILLIVSAVLLVVDISSFQKSFPSGEKLFLLGYNSSIIAGFSQSNDTVILTRLSDYANDVNSGSYSKVLAGRYKLFIFSMRAIEEAPVSQVETGNGFLSKEQAINLLKMDNPSESPLLTGGSLTDEQIKGVLFAGLASYLIKDPLYIISEYRSGNIIVYPETTLFKFLRYFPLKSIINGVGSALAKAGNSTLV